MQGLVAKVVSGGQTGVDRAALDVARELGIPCGGWCPAGRRAEDGPIPACYPLRETPSSDYAQRTEWNVRDAHATLVLARRPLSGGTALTVRLAQAYGRPHLVVDPQRWEEADRVRQWLEVLHGPVLNVAGPRDDRRGEVYRQARSFLLAVLAP